MSILTEEEIEACATDDGSDDLAFARAIESAVLAKLAGMELPEPEYWIDYGYEGWAKMDKEIFEKTPEEDRAIKYTAAQLHQAFAQGAASQLSAEPVAWMVESETQHGTKNTYPLTGRYKDVCDACDFGEPVPLYTLKEPK